MTDPAFLLIAHPSPDVYGSDRQLLESVGAAIDSGWRVSVVLPAAGPLTALLEEAGAHVLFDRFPVLRKADLSPLGVIKLAGRSVAATIRLGALIRRLRPTAVYVNTMTLPVWLLAAKLARVPALCHVHEAEEDQPRPVRIGMTAPLLLAKVVVANSWAAKRAITDVIRRLSPRISVVHNGVPMPPDPPRPPRVRAPGEPATIALVGRLSPRKGIDVALDAVAALRVEGRPVELIVCGSVFEGYEWYEDQLRRRIQSADLIGHVELAGYVHPTWPVLAGADIVLVPSRTEPFGNAAVEALLSCRPVVASNVQGLAEVIRADETGVLVRPGDAVELADGIRRMLDDPATARLMAERGLADAVDRFSVTGYRAAVGAELAQVALR